MPLQTKAASPTRLVTGQDQAEAGRPDAKSAINAIAIKPRLRHFLMLHAKRLRDSCGSVQHCFSSESGLAGIRSGPGKTGKAPCC